MFTSLLPLGAGVQGQHQGQEDGNADSDTAAGRGAAAAMVARPCCRNHGGSLTTAHCA